MSWIYQNNELELRITIMPYPDWVSWFDDERNLWIYTNKNLTVGTPFLLKIKVVGHDEQKKIEKIDIFFDSKPPIIKLISSLKGLFILDDNKLTYKLSNSIHKYGYLYDKIALLPTERGAFLISFPLIIYSKNKQLKNDKLNVLLEGTVSADETFDRPIDLLHKSTIEASKINRIDKSVMTISPESLFKEFQHWKRKFEYIREGKIKIDNKFLAQATIYSLQPAFLFDEINFLMNFVSDPRINLSPELRRILLSACKYYTITKPLNAKYEFGELLELRDLLSNPVHIKDEELKNWLELIRNDFLGLVYRRMADIAHEDLERRQYLKKAIDAFNDARKYIGKMKEKGPCWYLWNGYVYRNIGRTYCDLNDCEVGKSFLKKAEENRNQAYSMFKVLNVPELVLTQLYLETKIIKLDILKCCDDVRLEEKRKVLTETLEILRYQIKLIMKTFTLWDKVFVLAKDVAGSDKSLKDIYLNLQKLEETLFK